jgi:catechol 2,3-dioxygenase-like lactoylglutathione lyase family enzyme
MTPGHIGINVTNLERSASFYVSAFELQSMGSSSDDGRRFAFLGDGTNVVLTLWEQSEGRFLPHAPGLHHLAFRVDGIGVVRAAESRLRAAGISFLYDAVVPHAEGSSSGGIFFEDPDGTRLEIFAPNGAEGSKAPSGAAPSCGFF